MTDYTLYKELYLKCFLEDTPEDAEMLFKTVLSKALLLAEYDNGKPIAMLYLMDSDLVSQKKVYPFYYLYAACTDPKYRGQGIMQRLLEKAKKEAVKNGKLGIFLKPANPPLFDFYKKTDFLPFFNVLKTSMSAKDLKKLAKELNISLKNSTFKISMGQWQEKRKLILNSVSDLYADFNGDLFTAATDGCKCVCFNSESGVVYEKREDTLLIKEALCLPDKQDEIISLCLNLLEEISLSGEKVNYIELRLPVSLDCETLKPLGLQKSAFSVLWQNGELPKEKFNSAYHGFAFD